MYPLGTDLFLSPVPNLRTVLQCTLDSYVGFSSLLLIKSFRYLRFSIYQQVLGPSRALPPQSEQTKTAVATAI